MENEIREVIRKEYEKAEVSWGSCQYDTAAKTYQAFLEAFKQFGVKKTLKAFGINSFQIRPKEEIVNELEIEDIDTTKSIPIDSIEKYFAVAKDQAWDLWSAYLPINQILNTDDKLKQIELETFGPIFNQLAQSDNFEIGVSCAILTKIYEIQEESFQHFDT